MRFFLNDWIRCRGEEYVAFDLSASALIGVSQLTWPHMLLEIQTEAMLARYYQLPSWMGLSRLVPAIHVWLPQRRKTWMPGTRPGMTRQGL
jgi:hypothetical protein